MKSICPFTTAAGALLAPNQATSVRQQWLGTHTHTRRLCVVWAWCGLVENLTCRKGLHYCDYCNKKEAQVILWLSTMCGNSSQESLFPIVERAKELSPSEWWEAKYIRVLSSRIFGAWETNRREKRATMRSLFSFWMCARCNIYFCGSIKRAYESNAYLYRAHKK